MLNNLISKDDLPALREKLRQGQGPRILRRLMSWTSGERAYRAWEVTESPPKYWGSLEAVQQRWNQLTTGDPEETVYEYVARKYLGNREDWVALSPACGTGAHEVRWAQTGRFARIDGYDLSRNRIQKARERAALEGLEDQIRFSVGDIRKVDLPAASYDVVIAFNALHHITPLGPIIERIGYLLKPGGLLVVRDYVGPDRFQWTPGQLKAADKLLETLPFRYRLRWKSGSVKHRNFRLGRLAVRLSDPSEAAESSKILPLVDGRFEQLEKKDLGGTVLHLVLKDIAHHFARGDEKATMALERLIVAEDELLAKGEVGSDFVFGVWKKAV